MRLIYIVNARIPTEKAHGIQIMKMCETFASCVDVELILPRRFNPIKKDPFEYYGVEKSFPIKRLPCLDLIPFDKYLGHLALWIEAMSFCFFVWIYLFFKKADVIYTRDKFLLPLTLFKGNIFFEAHAIPKNYFLYSFFLKRLKGIIVITEQLKNIFLKNKIKGNKLLKAPDGVDIKKFDIQCSTLEARKKLSLPQDKKIVLYTGHLYKWKGADVLLGAAQQFSNTLFVFVGGTEKDIKTFKFQVSNFKLKNVLVVGHRPYSEIPYWLKAADVLILPNSGKEDISKYWTSPLKMFEYMAAKKPIVASNLPSIREILNENSAILVEPDDLKDLAQGIKKALEDSELSINISDKAYRGVQQYSWIRRGEKILKFINSKSFLV